MTAKMLMSLKEKVENHPLVFYFTTFFAGVALATGTFAPILMDQQHSATAKLDAQLATRQQQSEAKISDLERSLSSLPIQNGDQTKVIDVNMMQISRDEAGSVDPRTQYFPDGSFYALASSSDWRLTTTTELQLLADVVGVTPDKAAEGYATATGLEEKLVTQLLTAYPVHLWRSGAPQQIEGIRGLAALQPQLFVQRLPLTESADNSVDASEFPLQDYFQGDKVGQVLTSQILFFQALAGPQATTTLSSVEKAANSFYARFDTTFSDIRVNGKRVSQLFLSTQVISITTPRDLYIIKVTIPSPEPASEATPFVNQWLGAFRIVNSD